MITIERATTINGWMSPSELNWLAEQASRHNVIVEIGSFFGRSTRALGDNALGCVYAVDTWVGPIELGGKEIPSFEKEFRKNLRDLIEEDKIVIPMTPDDPLAARQPDMVFIDGDHAYASVVNDIQTWRPRISAGGLLCGHDASCPDVAKAVTELVPGYQIVSNTDIWYAFC